MAELVISTGEKVGTRFPLTGEAVVLGRMPDCEIHDVFERSPRVSRRHARLFRHDGHWRAQDLDSRNGTLLNGKPLKEETQLKNGDLITIGGISFEVVDASLDDSKEAKRSGGNDGAGGISVHEDDDPTIRSSVSLTDRSAFEAAMMEDASRKLRALVRLLGQTGQSLDTDEILDHLLEGLFDVFPNADHGFVVLQDDATKSFMPKAVRFRKPTEDSAIRVSRTIVERVMSSKEAVLSLNVSSDQRFEATTSILEHNIRTIMCAPLLSRSGTAIGVLQLETMDEAHRFSHEDLGVLASVAPHAATALDYAVLHAEELKQQSLQQDLQFARQVQRNFLPSAEPALTGYEFFAYYEAAYHVGGDYYDYVDLGNGRLGIIVADVAGKGISAALIMSKFAGEFKYLMSQQKSLAAAVEQMNDAMCEDEGMSRFITVAALVLNSRDHEVTIVNAGHTDTLLRRPSGEVMIVGDDIKGTPVGMFPSQTYEEATIQLGKGDLLMLYTDGLSEATRSDRSMYGADRVIERIGKGPQTPRELGEYVLKDMKTFVGDCPQSDDICIISVRRADS